MANTYLTLADWSRRVGPDGSIDIIAEMLSQCNEIFEDMLWREGNLPIGHQSTVRTALPKGTFRQFNQGVAFTKSLTAQIVDGVCELVAYSRIDRSEAELNGNVTDLRWSEDVAHMEGLTQQMATTLFYGNIATSPTQFNGLATRYPTVNAATLQSAANVFDGGGTGSSNTSLWLVGWGDRATFGIFPKGSKAGLTFEDKGLVRPGFDSNNNEYEAYTSYFNWKAGLVVSDWRTSVRTANLDTTTAGLAGATPPDLFALMSAMAIRLPTSTRRFSGITKTDAPDEPDVGVRLAWYVNRVGRRWMDIQAIRDKNVLLNMKEYDGMPVTEYRGVPIRVCDALLSTEARVV